MDINVLIDLHYNQKLSLSKISKDYKIDRNRLSIILNKSGYKPINYQNTMKIEQTIFDIIDTEEKAYWLGFIYADGSISNDIFEIGLAEIDISHLVKFKQFINWTNEIKYKKSNKSVRVSFRNKHFISKLKELGVTEQKSLILTFPNNIPKHLISHFIRGYFDGDGCIHFRKNVIKKNVLVNLLGTPQFLSVFRDYSPIKVNKLYKNHNSDQTLVYQITGKKAEDFLYWLYNDATIYLNRKKELYNQIDYGNIK